MSKNQTPLRLLQTRDVDHDLTCCGRLDLPTLPVPSAAVKGTPGQHFFGFVDLDTGVLCVQCRDDIAFSMTLDLKFIPSMAEFVAKQARAAAPIDKGLVRV